jgi:hypothetical protein
VLLLLVAHHFMLAVAVAVEPLLHRQQAVKLLFLFTHKE